MITKDSIYVNMQVSVTSLAEDFSLAKILLESNPQSQALNIIILVLVIKTLISKK